MESPGEFNYVVVGAGSAGCVVAARLSESGTHRVALIEAGGEDDSFWIHAPLGYGMLYDKRKYNWFYQSEPEPELEGVRFHQPRGKVLGGTSSINGMVYMRGQRQDYDYWRELGNTGWGYAEVLPYFKKAEDNDAGGNEYRGAGGPVGVSSLARHELAEAFIKAGQQAGYARNDDFNGASQEGFGYQQVTIRKGRRSSTAVAYLRPARSRRNLHVITDALATRILFRDGRADGIEFKKNGAVHTVRASREVIISGGTSNSPQLLQLSGLGPVDLLREHGIPVIANLPGVGANLQNHFTVDTRYRCTRPITLNDVVNNPLRRWAMGLQYVLFGNGLMATNANYCGGCVATDPASKVSDVKLRLRLWGRAVRGRTDPKKGMGLCPFPSFEVGVSLLHPDSRGTVLIKSSDPAAPPQIRFNYFVSEADRRTAAAAVRVIKRVMSMPAITPYVAEELTPVPDADDELIKFCRERGRSNHHEAGTCKMGIDDHSVVDPRLRVHGVDGLRVIDASIMPRIAGGDTNAVVIMIGEKGAAMVIEDLRTA